MTSDRPKVGDAFRTPDRTVGLAGMLPPAPTPTPRIEAPAPAVPNSDSAALELVTGPPATDVPQPDKPVRSRRRPDTARVARAGTRSEADDASHEITAPARPETRIVSVALDASVLTDLRNFAVRTEQTHGAVTLRAIEANADALATHWDRPQPVDPAAGRLFAGTPAIRRRTEPVVQTQIRLVAADTDTLDRLVHDWAAPSRSALVNEALSRYVRPTEQDPS